MTTLHIIGGGLAGSEAAWMAARAGVVDEHLAVEPQIKERHAIGRAIRADARKPAAKAVRQQLVDPRVGHDAVGTPQLW